MKYEVPIWEKSNLTLEEAAACSGIGINKLRKDNVRLPWQECMDFLNSIEPQRFFGLLSSNLHHPYTTHFVTIYEP